MPYTNPDGTAAYLIDGMDSGGFLIANSTEAITGDVYAQKLTFSGSGGVLSDCTISSGGTITMGTSTIISGANQTIGIYAGGSMLLSSGATLRNFELYDGAFVSGSGATKLVSGTVYSGASVKYSGNSMYAVTVKSGGYVSAATGLYISCATVESGATLAYGGRVKWCGKENHIAAGTINGRPNVYTDENGVLYNYNGGTAATDLNNIVVSNLTISATTYASSRTSAYDITHKGGVFYVFSSARLHNYNNSVGGATAMVQIYHGSSATYSAAVYLGGSNTNIRQGTVRYWAATNGTYTDDPNIYATNGSLYGVTLRAKEEGENYWLLRLNLIDGVSAYQPVISAGGSLYVWSGAAAVGAEVHDHGVLWVWANGYADAPRIHAGGALFTSSATVDNLVIESNETTAGYLLVSNGIRLNLGGSETNFAAGTVRYGSTAVASQYIDESFRAENGKLYGLTIKSSGISALKNLGIRDGISAVETVVSSGGTLRVSSGAVLLNPTLYVNGKTYIYEGGLVSGGVVSGGNGSTGAYQVLHISSGGSGRGVTQVGGVIYLYQGGKLTDSVISGGRVYFFDGPGETGHDDRPKISGADIAVTGTGKVTFRGVNVYGSHITVDTPNGFVGAQNGTLVEDITLTNGGVTYVYTNPGTGTVDSGAVATIRNIKAIDGVVSVGLAGIADGIDMQTGTISCFDQTGLVLNARVSGGVVSMMGTLSNTTLTGGEIIASNGATVRDITADAGNITVSGGAVMSGATINGGTVIFSSGAAVEGIAIHGGDVRLSKYVDATDVTLYDGQLTVYDYTNVNNVLEISGGYANLGRNAIINDGLTVHAGASARVNTLADVVGSAWNLKIDVSGSVVAADGTTLEALNVSGGVANIGSGATANDMTVTLGVANLASGATVSGATVLAGTLNAESGAVFSGAITAVSGAIVNNVQLAEGATFDVSNNADAYGAVIQGAATNIAAGQLLFNGTATDVAVVNGEVNDLAVTAASPKLAFGAGITVNDATVTGGEVAFVAGATVNGITATAGKVGANWGTTITNAQITGDATLDDSYDEDTQGATIAGANTNIVAGGLLYYGADTGATVENGVVTGLGANGEYYRVTFGEGITIDAAKVNGNCRFYTYGDAQVYDLAIIGDGGATASVVAWDDSEYYDTVLTRVDAGAQLNLRANNKAYNTVVNSGTLLRVDATARAIDTTILYGGSMEILTDTAIVEGTLTLAYNGTPNKNIKITNVNRIPDATTVRMTGVDKAGYYGITSAGGTLAKMNIETGLYREEIASGGAAFTNGAKDLAYTFDGTKLTAADAGIATAAAAAKLADGATEINNGDKAAKWDATTTYTANVFLADGLTTGNAWLDIDGFTAGAASLFGTAKDQDFAGSVNIGANAGTIKNLAAGAGLGGSVAGVKLTVGETMTVTGAVYAGGMGDVTNETETLVEGGTFAGNVFAGALCNYAANQTATATGNINLTVNGGTFAGNIYAGAAVKAGAATTTVHTAGDITVELNDGTATKGTFCVYGGGYATGTVEDALVYTAGDVAISVDGGSWGTYLSGRGIFGGAYADKVAAAVDSVAISVTGGTMGNVYGGGWAQNGGTSTVAGEVNITIDGDAQVANVFGGGSCSGSSYGTTTVGSVNITVAGGDVANNIFAGGQNEFSTVLGDVSVTFTGSSDYACNVFGYGVQESATVGGDKTLAFAAYTGTLSGNIGGFDGIVISGDTAATLSGAAIDNDDWTFDYTGRTLDAATAMVTFDAGELSGEVAVDLADVEQAASGWSIAAGLDSAVAAYGVELSTGSASGLRLNDTLDSSYGIYEGWGFTLEDSTLKFKHLA